MRQCSNCGEPIADHVQICHMCNFKLPRIGVSTRLSYEETLSGYHSNSRYGKRPTGITILAVMFGTDILGNTLDGLNNLTFEPIIGIYSFLVVFFEIFVFYGLWKMKTWGGIAAILLISVGMLWTTVMTIFLSDMIIELATHDVTIPYGSVHLVSEIIDLSQLYTVVGWIGAIFIVCIIIVYINSKKDYFVN